MVDWLITLVVLLFGFMIMVTGLIQYLYIAFLFHLLIIMVMGILGRIWLCFQDPNDK